MHKIDILLMTDNSLDTIGGSEESTKIIISGVKDKFSLGVIQPGNISNPQLGVHYFPLIGYKRIKHFIQKPLTFIKYIWEVKKIINREKPKIIHTQAQVSFFIVALLKKLNMIHKNIQFMHTERGLYIRYSTFFKNLFHFFIKELDTLITTTEFNMKYWKKALNNKYNLSYIVIENTAGEIYEIYDEKLKVNNSRLVIGFAGRYSDQKNWPLAVQICERLYSVLGENLEVIMAVGCLDKNSKLLTEKMFCHLKNMLGKDNFTGKINIDMNEMNNFYYSIDVFIMTSEEKTESFGRTLVEAMSRNTVVLSTLAGGPEEIIRDTDNLCVSANDFVNRIMMLYKNSDLMNKQKELNINRFKKKYSLENNVEKHLRLYSDIN